MTQNWSVPRPGTSSRRFTVREAYEYIQTYELAQKNMRTMNEVISALSKQKQAPIYITDKDTIEAFEKAGLI
jgi:hypothetical protein